MSEFINKIKTKILIISFNIIFKLKLKEVFQLYLNCLYEIFKKEVIINQK